MQINHPSTAPDYNAGELRTGKLITKVLAVGRERALNCYRFSLEITPEETWSTPSHRHNFDQIRLHLEGEYSFLKDQWVRGVKVGYYPESMYYGPQVRHHGDKTLNLQFGGASRNGFMTPRERRIGYDELMKRGWFEKGAYTWLDDRGKRHRREAYTAVWELMRGRRITYAKPRYDTLLHMDPEVYEWREDASQPGVAFKHLGSFTENNFTINFIRLDRGATVTIDQHTAPQVLYVITGAVTVAGKTHGPDTGFALDEHEGPVRFSALESTQLYFVRLPTFQGDQDIAFPLFKGSSAA
jgi:quercetin dioxygenase-like cupin family protein